MTEKKCMITEAQYAAATALFTAISGRQETAGKEEAFALFRQCLATVLEGPAVSSGRVLDVEVACTNCGERIGVRVPAG